MSRRESLPFSTTIHVRDTCVCLHLQRAARVVARRFDEALRPLDLTNGQFSLLMSLNRPEPARMRDVSTLLAMDRTTLTANLKPLERRGLVTIAVDPVDKRSRKIALTAKGHEILIAAMPIWKRTHAELDEALPRRNATPLRADLLALS
jgi:DNA-binding MarR family transcriptional regulator